MEKKNYGKSVRIRLVNLMNETGYKYMYLLARYFNERLLYRVSVSQYKDNFLLKGGSLLYALDGLEARPTIDVDFMADKISRDRETLTEVFKKIVAIDCDEDGVFSAPTYLANSSCWVVSKNDHRRRTSNASFLSISLGIPQ